MCVHIYASVIRGCPQLLSACEHYDWGLRAVKSVLVVAGELKRGDPTIDERRTLLRALRDTNMAKLSKDDIYVFMKLISALFPNMEVWNGVQSRHLILETFKETKQFEDRILHKSSKKFFW